MNTETHHKMMNSFIYLIFGLVVLVMGLFIIDIWPESTPEPESTQPVVALPPMKQAEIHIDNGRLWAAIDEYTQAITEESTNEKAWHEKGKLNRVGSCTDAVLHYEKYLV